MKTSVLGSALLCTALAGSAAGNAVAASSVALDRAGWVSNRGERIAAQKQSRQQSFGISPSWRGIDAVAVHPSAGSRAAEGPEWEASGAGTDTVIGADRRVRMKTTTVFPRSATTYITFDQHGQSRTCSGWMISKDTVATAGHCLNSGPAGGSVWSTNVKVYPGRNGSSSPYGSCDAKTLWSNDGWTKNGDEKFDYGAIKLNCTIGNTTGWYGMYWTSATLKGTASSTLGYPTDKLTATQWLAKNCAGASGFQQCHIVVSQEQQLFYYNDTDPARMARPSTTISPRAAAPAASRLTPTACTVPILTTSSTMARASPRRCSTS
ncbi:MAG: trypsin-like serine peptidase [Alphaproteobacteria bacterium]